jgi:anti-anti-sigma factor
MSGELSRGGAPMTVNTRAPGAVRFGRVAGEIELTGEIDLASQDHLDHLLVRLMARPVSDITVDLSRVSFMGCTGLAFLIELHAHACHAGCRVVLHAPRPVVLRALRLSDCEPLFTVTGVPTATAPADGVGGSVPQTTA